MPIFHARCHTCGGSQRFLAASWSNIRPTTLLCECGGSYQREARGPSTQLLERLDNGAMVRAVERPADAERMHAERAMNADPLAGGAGRVKPEPPDKA